MSPGRLKIWFPYLFLAGVALAVLASNARRDNAALPQAAGKPIACPPCGMEVNPRWGISSTFGGGAYYFCTERCKRAFDREPRRFVSARCLVCKQPPGVEATFPATYLGRTYELCSEAHRQRFKSDPAAWFLHTMWGIPPGLYYASIALVLIFSFGLFDRLGRSGLRNGSLDAGSASLALASDPPSIRPREAPRDRWDLLSRRWIRALARSRIFRFSLQAAAAGLFLLLIAAGLFGNQNPALNLAPLLTWTVWWGFLPILILFAGKAWCYVCPWDAVAGWTERLSLWKKGSSGLSLGWRWPRAVRNISIATILFLGLTWVELGFGVTMKPRVTAWLALAMLFLAILAAMLFERKSFCRYGCLVGRVSGLYALFAGCEVRSRSAETCLGCRTKECIQGSRDAYGCPTFLYPGKLAVNTYCIQCLECLQACPHDNLAINLRPWGSDLAAAGKPRADEAYLALFMLSMTGFHGLTMTPVWQRLVESFREQSNVGKMAAFSLGMALIILLPVALYATLVKLSQTVGNRFARPPLTYQDALTYKDYFIRYAYALLPIALFYHVAHNLEHLLMEGPKVLALISDPFGWNWNLFGTAGWSVPPLLELDKLWLVQAVLVLAGHVYSLWIAQKTSLRLFGGSRAAFWSQLPMLAGMIAFSVFSLWLLKQPMEMRTSTM